MEEGMASHGFELPDPGSLPPVFPPGEADGILWWISTLGCGGAERQVIVTGQEFRRRGIPVSLACQRLLNYRGDTHYLARALEIFSAVHDLTMIPQKGSRRRGQRRKEIRHEVAACWKAGTGSDFFRPVNLRDLAGKVFLRKGSAPRTIPGVHARETARRAALPFRELFSPKEYAALEHHAACFVELKPALLHVWSAEHLYVPVAAVLAGVPRVIVSARTFSPPHRIAAGLPSMDHESMRKALLWVLRFPGTSLAALSRAVAEDFANWLGIPARTVAVTYNIFDARARQPLDSGRVAALRARLGIPEAAPVIGGLARFEPVKNPELWIETVCRVLERDTSICAVLGGSGELLGYCRNRAATSVAAERIILPGTVREVDELYALLSVFLLTSHVEGLGNVLLEAQYAGVPVVSTKAGGAPSEIVRHGETGWIVESDAALLAERLWYVLTNEAWSAAARAKAPDAVLTRFSPTRAIDALRPVYHPFSLN